MDPGMRTGRTRSGQKLDEQPDQHREEGGGSLVDEEAFPAQTQCTNAPGHQQAPPASYDGLRDAYWTNPARPKT